LTHIARTPIDVAAAMAQHERYEDALRTLGCRIERLPDAPELPDSVFVEDTAVVLDEVAIVTRPGAESRRAETPSIAAALRRHRTVLEMTEPATLDGGDVLVVGRRLFVGISDRTTDHGARQLADLTAPYGYSVSTVSVQDCLHLKSAVTALEANTLLCNPDWVDTRAFAGFNTVAVAPDEPFAANVLQIGSVLLCAAAHARTAADLTRRGYAVYPVDVSELAKAEGGVTCCSLMVRYMSRNAASAESTAQSRGERLRHGA
jgi:dimethylargininase